MTFIADRLKKIKPSMTVGINIKANALRAEGKAGGLHERYKFGKLESLKFKMQV